MAFWSSEKIQQRQAQKALIEPFIISRVAQGAYELSLGFEGAISCDGRNQVVKLKDRDFMCIPRGQFALLLTKESVLMPNDAIGFISLKTKVKSKGLVNVSGFHVDPGYERRLKFWVYNAGNEDIQIQCGDPTFLIWFSDLDRPTQDTYKKNSPSHDEITSDDLRQLRGHLASPSALLEEIDSLKTQVRIIEYGAGLLLAVVIGIVVAAATPFLDPVIKPIAERIFGKAPPSSTPLTVSASATVSPQISAPPPTITVPTPTPAPTNTPPTNPPAAPASNATSGKP
jgi:dCTP deaminase